MAPSLDNPAALGVAGNSSATVASTTAVHASAMHGAGLVSGTGAAIIGRSSTSLDPASSTLSRSCAVFRSGGLLSSGTDDAGELNIDFLLRQLAVAKHQCDVARQKLASVRFELNRIRDENEKLPSPLVKSRSSLLAWCLV